MAPPSLRTRAVTPRRRFSAKRFVLRLLAVLVLFGAVALYRDRSGAPVGGPCTKDGDCRGLFSATCLREGRQGYCSHDCKDDGDCESGFQCGRIRWTDVKAGKRNEMNACVQAVARFEVPADAVVVGAADAGTDAAAATGSMDAGQTALPR